MVDPDELTPAERIDATRRRPGVSRAYSRRSSAGNSFATPLEIARLQGAVEALGAIAGELRGDER